MESFLPGRTRYTKTFKWGSGGIPLGGVGKPGEGGNFALQANLPRGECLSGRPVTKVFQKIIIQFKKIAKILLED